MPRGDEIMCGSEVVACRRAQEAEGPQGRTAPYVPRRWMLLWPFGIAKRDIVSCEEDAAAPTLGDIMILDMFAYDVHSQHDLPLPHVRVQRQRISVRSLHRGLTGLRHG
jgi:hypothetical protein